MNRSIFLATVWLCLSGCAYLNSSGSGLTETQPQWVSGCTLVGMVSEIADADQLSGYLATRRMIQAVKDRARHMGATHIVWLHQTSTSAAVQAYACPDR